MDTGNPHSPLPVTPPAAAPPQPETTPEAPIQLLAKDLPAAAIIHMRPDEMPAPLPSHTPPLPAQPVETPVFRPAVAVSPAPPIVPPPAPTVVSKPVTPPPSVPAPAAAKPMPPPPLPVISPVVIETKPDRAAKNSKSPSIGTWIAVVFLVMVFLIGLLYFWGAQIAAQA